MYDFNSLSPINLLPFHNTFLLKYKDVKANTDFLKKLCQEVKIQFEKKNENYVKYVNKNMKKVVFEFGVWVWIHMRKKIFSIQRNIKLHPTGDDPVQMCYNLNGNAYKIKVFGEYCVSATFNVAYLSFFDVSDNEFKSRSSYLQERGNDEGMEHQNVNEVIQIL